MQSFYSELQWIETQIHLQIEQLKQLVLLNSYSHNFSGLKQTLQSLQSLFASLDAEMTIIPLLSSAQDFSSKFALSIRKRTHAPKQILLAGHYDTVYLPTVDFPFVQDSLNDRLQGPGVADMKGGIIVLLTALQALERSEIKEQLGWEVLLTPDEEIGSQLSAPLYETAAKRNHLGLIFEPALADGAFVSERKGSANYFIEFQGKSAHAGRDFANGRSAVFSLARLITHVNSFNTNDLTINVAELTGEGPLNIVPDYASCRINCRSFSLEQLNHLQTELEQMACQELKKQGIQIKITKETYRPPKSFELCKPVFEEYEKCAQLLNIPFAMRSTGGVCDGNLLAGAGLPTLDTAGVVGGNLHTTDEYLKISSLQERSKLAALFLLKLAAGEFL